MRTIGREVPTTPVKETSATESPKKKKVKTNE
jgi:hypothetical protein